MKTILNMTRSEKINLSATVLGPILVSCVLLWVGWSFKVYIRDEIRDQNEKNAVTYVARVVYEDNRAEDSKQLGQISTDVGRVKEDVATIKGELMKK